MIKGKGVSAGIGFGNIVILKNEVRNLKYSIEAARIGEKEITNVDLLRRISQLEKIILGKEQQ